MTAAAVFGERRRELVGGVRKEGHARTVAVYPGGRSPVAPGAGQATWLRPLTLVVRS